MSYPECSTCRQPSCGNTPLAATVNKTNFALFHFSTCICQHIGSINNKRYCSSSHRSHRCLDISALGTTKHYRCFYFIWTSSMTQGYGQQPFFSRKVFILMVCHCAVTPPAPHPAERVIADGWINGGKT